jgi:uncharacterized protein (TIGR03382 family)
MRSLWLVLLLVAAAEPARASTCVLGPFARPAFNPPTDCTVRYYRRAGEVDPPPRAQVYRNNVPVDVTATVTQVQPIDLDMGIYTVDCDGNVVAESHYQEPFDVFEITLTGALPDEDLYAGQLSLGKVQAAGGACENTEIPVGTCTGMYDWSQCQPPPGDDVTPETEDAVGCNATHGASSLLGIALLGAALRRRRR